MLSALAQACPGLSLLVTSRRALQVEGERLVVIAPLPVGGGGESPAVGLYCDRARAVDADFEMSEVAMSAIAAICRRLDGLPLAIELAAARSRTMTPTALLARLAGPPHERWSVLGRRRTAGGKGPLEDTIGWSLEQLTPDESVVFGRLGAFGTTWSLDAAEAVGIGGAVLDGASVLDALSTLVDVHLVEPVHHPKDGQRFRLLDTIAEVARERLALSGEDDAVRRRHADFYRAEMIRAGSGLESPDEADWYTRIDADVPDLRVALEWLASRGRIEDVLRAAGALGPYWLNRGRFAAGRQWLDSAGSNPDNVAPEIALVARGWSARLALDGRAGGLPMAAAIALVEELEDVLRQTDANGEPACWLRACEHVSYAHRLFGDAERARQVCLQAIGRCRNDDLLWWRAEHLLRLSLVSGQLGDLGSAARYAQQARDAAAASDNRRVLARARQAAVQFGSEADLDAARRELAEVHALSEAFGDRRGAAATKVFLGAVAVDAADVTECGRWVAAAITESRDIGYQHGVGLAQIVLVVQAVALRDWELAGTLHGALQDLLPALRRQLSPAHAAAYDAQVRIGRAQAGAAAFAGFVAAGRRLGWDAAADLALSAATELSVTATAPTETKRAREAEPAGESLSAREREVLALIAVGLTNQQIGRQLYLSPKTVMHHSSHIYRKLGVRGRAEAVAHAGRQGLLPAGSELPVADRTRG